MTFRLRSPGIHCAGNALEGSSERRLSLAPSSSQRAGLRDPFFGRRSLHWRERSARQSIARFFLAVTLGLTTASCGGDSTGPPDEPPTPASLSAVHTLAGPDGGAPRGGGTLASRVIVTNDGDETAYDLVLFHTRLDRFEHVSTSAGTSPAGTITTPPAQRLGRPALTAAPGEPPPPVLETDPVSIAGGESRTFTFEFGIPALFPDGFTREVSVDYRFDPDGSGPELATGGTFARTRAAFENEGLTFPLSAPGVAEVYWAGQFNNWSFADPDYSMFPDEEGDTWGITIPTTGRQEYKFNVRSNSGSIEWIGDPRATHLSPDGFGAYNSVAGIALPPPVAPLPGGIDPERLVIYELFAYDFSSRGDFRGVIEGLNGPPQDLVDLGINAIELLPITGIRPGFNWGYQPEFYFAIEPDYGTPESFAELVETAHANGIAVILDMVFNHIGSGAPLERINDLGVRGTYINDGQEIVFGMRQLNWFSQPAREFLLDAALFWIEQFGIDGFRMDLVDSRDYEGYRWWRNEIAARHPDFFLIGEDFSNPPNNSIVVAGFDAQWGGQHTDPWGGVVNNFQNQVMALLKEGPYSGRGWFPPRGSFDAADNPMWALANITSPTVGNPSHTNDVRYIVSHDEHRVVWEVENEGSVEARDIGGVRKAKLGAATLLTATGIPMLYMGEEIGAANEIFDSPTPNKVDWAQANSSMRATYRDLVRLRLSHPSLAAGGIVFHCPSFDTPQGPCQRDKTIAYWRFEGSNSNAADVVVASNFDHAEHAFTIRFPSSGTWYLHDPETGETPVNVAGGTLAVTLPVSSASIYLKKPARVR